VLKVLDEAKPARTRRCRLSHRAQWRAVLGDRGRELMPSMADEGEPGTFKIAIISKPIRIVLSRAC